jgi:hypothetical protein
MSKITKQSTQDGLDPYLKAGFLLDPSNHFWEKPSHRVKDDKTGYVEIVHEWTPAAKEYYRKCAERRNKEAGRYKIHTL